jgi:hypothetical protein
MASKRGTVPTSFPVSERNKVQQLHERGSSDEDSVFAVVDAVETCARPKALSGFPPGHHLDEVTTENYGRTDGK